MSLTMIHTRSAALSRLCMLAQHPRSQIEPSQGAVAAHRLSDALPVRPLASTPNRAAVGDVVLRHRAAAALDEESLDESTAHA
jgi:hypothetical protein